MDTYEQTTKNINAQEARPFVKWAGGKGQLVEVLKANLPEGMGTTIRKFAEPLVGGGAFMFALLNEYSFDEVYINDHNEELINAYSCIKTDCADLIAALKTIEREYIPLSAEARQEYYYIKRELFNELSLNGENAVTKAALFIFLNRTCFNGLYRVNRAGKFNVPVGRYKTPHICDEENLSKVSKKLQNVTIKAYDYHDVQSFADENTLVYLDPPYRPLNATSGFTSYTEYAFDDNDQIELARFARRLSDKGVKVMISNSDPHNVNPDDNFFDELYAKFTIQRIQAFRTISSKADKRGFITELLIKNYP